MNKCHDIVGNRGQTTVFSPASTDLNRQMNVADFLGEMGKKNRGLSPISYFPLLNPEPLISPPSTAAIFGVVFQWC